MKNIAALIRVLAIVVACVSIAGAQTVFRELNADSRGRGAISFDNQRDENITNATVLLRRNGDAEIRLVGRTTWTFTGRWTAGTGQDVDLDLNGAGSEARGRVTLTRSGNLDRLELTGRSRGQRFTANFDADRRGDSQQGGGGGGGNRGADFVGVYRSSYSPTPRPDDFKLIRTLRIREDGSAELVSRYQNRPPVMSQSNLRLLGNLIRNVESRKKINHTGSWRAFGRRLEVTLTNLDGDTRAVSRMTFEFRNADRSELSTTAWDRNDYGTVGFEFRRTDADDNDDDSNQGGGQGQTPDRVAGSYSTRLRVPDSDAEIERTLQLSPNGDARLTTELVGGRDSRMSFRAVRELGRLVRRLETQRTIVHYGRWQSRNGQIVVDFDNLDRTREPGSITFEARGDTLEAVRVDQNQYGDGRFSLERRR
jgi:hypothetical protein